MMTARFRSYRVGQCGSSPKTYIADRISSASQLQRLVQESAISLRGWTFPIVGRVSGALWTNFDGGSQSHFNVAGQRPEALRVYKSGLVVWSSGFGEDTWHRSAGQNVISFVSLIYSVTEWVLFAKRFYETILSVDERVHLTVRASGIRGRRWSHSTLMLSCTGTFASKYRNSRFAKLQGSQNCGPTRRRSHAGSSERSSSCSIGTIRTRRCSRAGSRSFYSVSSELSESTGPASADIGPQMIADEPEPRPLLSDNWGTPNACPVYRGAWSMPLTRDNHFVPQLYLRNFSTASGEVLEYRITRLPFKCAHVEARQCSGTGYEKNHIRGLSEEKKRTTLNNGSIGSLNRQPRSHFKKYLPTRNSREGIGKYSFCFLRLKSSGRPRFS